MEYGFDMLGNGTRGASKGFMPGHSGGKGFKVRRDDEPLEIVGP